VFFKSSQGRTATSTPQPAQAQYYLRIKHPGGGEPVRLAVAALRDLWLLVPDPLVCSLKAGGGGGGGLKQQTDPVFMECIEAACTLHDWAVMEPWRGKP
jgi:hypothetical protein